jgi:hypothetical protein
MILGIVIMTWTAATAAILYQAGVDALACFYLSAAYFIVQ